MDELTVKNRIVEAMNEPPPLEQLVRGMIVRAKAIVAGRRAEERLEREERQLSLEDRTKLAATGMIGLLAGVAALPEGATPEGLAAQLAAEPRFVRAVEGGNTLARLRNGELLSAVTWEPQPQREAPAPEQSGPARGGPSV